MLVILMVCSVPSILTLDSGYVVLWGDLDSTRLKGASQGAVHSTADG